MPHVLLGLALVLLLGFDALIAGAHDPIPFRVLLQSSHFFDDYEAGAEVPSAFVVLRSESEEAAFLDAYPRNTFMTGSGDTYRPPFPDVNYRTETAVVIALGTRGSGSISVRLDSVVVEGGAAVAYATEVIPRIQTRDMANPATVVAVEGARRGVTFAPLRQERE